MVWCKVGKAYYLLLVFTCYMLWCSCCIHVEAAPDSLKPGDSLMSNKTRQLCSANNKYCIFFFRYSQERDLIYLGISSERNDIVWIANRNQPYVNISSLDLSLEHSGVLKIESQVEKPIILYSPPPHSTTTNMLATLLDTGNFVLQQLNPNGSTKSVLWQSFDYPTDALFPGMKLGANRKTGHSWSLVSYVSLKYPHPGPFSLEWEPKEGELNIKRRGRVIWKSGKLRNNNKFFENIPEESQLIYKYTIVSNQDEDYFTFTALNKMAAAGWVMYTSGQLKGTEEGKVIARADLCYGYKSDGGCQKWEIPSCRHPGDVFESREGYPNFTYMWYYYSHENYGLSDCEANCWSNCSCVGFISEEPNRCAFFSGKSLEGVPSVIGGTKFYMLVKKPQRRGMKRWIWIIVVTTTALLIICSCILCLVINKRKRVLEDKRRKIKENDEMQDLTASEESIGIKNLEDDLNKGYDFKIFNYTSVMEITNKFSIENKLGQGGFGPVYKGILPSGKEVAVKRLSKNSSQGIIEFKNELKLICELQHMNLVQLIGCCIHEQERILMYEYMSNKSLDFFLFDRTRSKLLNWQQRFNIIKGICQGLLYFHKYSRLKIIHRDLKASNILLDENMNPKISDFGMARMFKPQESTVNTNRIVGTYGYMSPEYVMEGVFSTKSDIYSFGVLLLEIVSGRRNNSFYDAEHPLNLIGHAWELWNGGVCLQLMDPSLNGMFDPNEAERCIYVDLLCAEHYAKDRPNMSDIISMLTNKSVAVTLPRRPAFYFGKQIFEVEAISKSIESNTDFTKEISTSTEIEAL